MSLWRLIWAKFFSTTFLETNVLAIIFPLPSSRGCVLFKVHLRGFEPLALSQLWSHWSSLTVLLSTDIFALQVIFSPSMSFLLTVSFFCGHVIFRRHVVGCCRWFSLPLLENCPICRPWGENFAQNVFPGKLLLPALPPLLSCAASPWQLNKVEGSAPHCSGPLPNDDQRYQLQLQRLQGWSKISTQKISRMIKDINSKDFKDDQRYQLQL